MNDLQEKTALVTRRGSAVGLAAAFGMQTSLVGDRPRGFGFFDRDHAQEIATELLRQGALIANFFQGRS